MNFTKTRRNTEVLITGAEVSSLSYYRDKTESYRNSSEVESMLDQPHPPKILLVDDELSFCKVMARVARNNGTPLMHVSSLDQLKFSSDFEFDVAVVDYDLGAITGFEMSTYIESCVTREVPIILISQSERKFRELVWPEAIREFVHKKLGYSAVLDAALEAHEVSKIQKNFKIRGW